MISKHEKEYITLLVRKVTQVVMVIACCLLASRRAQIFKLLIAKAVESSDTALGGEGNSVTTFALNNFAQGIESPKNGLVLSPGAALARIHPEKIT